MPSQIINVGDAPFSIPAGALNVLVQVYGSAGPGQVSSGSGGGGYNGQSNYTPNGPLTLTDDGMLATIADNGGPVVVAGDGVGTLGGTGFNGFGDSFHDGGSTGTGRGGGGGGGPSGDGGDGTAGTGGAGGGGLAGAGGGTGQNGNNAGGGAGIGAGQTGGDAQGQVTWTIPPLVAGTLSLTSRSSSTAALATTASTGGSGTRLYQLQRAPDAGGAAGSYSNVGAQQSTLTWNDSGLTPAASYWYRVVYGDSNGDSITGAGIKVTTLAVAGVLASVLSPFEMQMINSALDALYGQFGVAGVYTAPDSAADQTPCTLRIHRQEVREVERSMRANGELQTAEIMVRSSELAVIEKDGRFLLGGGVEAWTVANRPTLKNGEHICSCTRTGTERLMPRRGKE